MLRRDTNGIVDPRTLTRRVRYRRLPPAPELARWIEHYWFIDWDLAEPHTQHVVGHPTVTLTVMKPTSDDPVTGRVTGPARALFTIELAGRGWVRGAQFRPGAARAFLGRSPGGLAGRQVPVAEALPAFDWTAVAKAAELMAPDEAVVAVLDAALIACAPVPDPRSDQAVAIVEAVREDRSLRRVDEVARAAGLSVRALQRLFAEQVGVSPKWVLLRYRIHDAVAAAAPEVDWAGLAADLGYADQAHLVRDFTATLGVPPVAYAARLPPASERA
ncbi:helix-turn-helix domain-containing protein [Hamadaea tsunoensis]|uniref:helix-turn-helix domain-containing protein n=1 Tax=Hamadaea tsunoensis TaxID=53368 RepID=UPI00041DA395|nr:AraC family transcriptional regulator [Hamadaea tsunoensis]